VIGCKSRGRYHLPVAVGLRDAAYVYKVDVDAITATVKQEFAVKEKGKTSKKAPSKSTLKPAKRPAT